VFETVKYLPKGRQHTSIKFRAFPKSKSFAGRPGKHRKETMAIKANFKKTAALLAAIAIILTGAAAITSARVSQAKSGTVGAVKTAMRHLGTPPTTGTVSAISGNSITLAGKNGATYTVDAGSAKIVKISNGAKTTIAVSGIQTGDVLAVTGTVTGNNIVAKNITDGVMTMPVKQQPAATGTVSAISGNSITLAGSNGTTYTVDASNVQISILKSGVSLQNSGVQTGDTLTIFGAVSGSNITATRIMDGKLGAAKMGFMMGK
jgi:hypothetical protein